jgi:hypothetical protein
MNDPYFRFCDKIVREFFSSSLEAERISPDLRKFDFDFMPEPYLPLVDSDRRPNSDFTEWLHILLANPGRGLNIQKRNYLRSGKMRGVSEKIPYSQFAHMVYRYYEKYFPKRKELTAIHHFRNAQKLASLSGYQGALEIESIPWHSKNLCNKDDLPSKIMKDEVTNRYCTLLRAYLKNRSVLTVDGAGGQSTSSISDAAFDRPWMRFKADLIGMDIGKAKFHAITEKASNGKITAAAKSMRVGGVIKIMYCVRGHNHLKGKQTLAKLQEILTR